MQGRATASPVEGRRTPHVARLGRLRDRLWIARRALAERAFDWRRGVSTAGQFVVSDYPPGAGHDAFRYVGTSARQLRHIVAKAGIDPSTFTFVDLGAGKGRTLIVALELGFRAVVGIELSPALVAIAERNLAGYTSRYGGVASTRIIAEDAGRFPLPSGAIFLYLFNPFGETTMRALLHNLERSATTRSDRLLIAYLRPQHDSLLAGAAFLSPIARDAPRSVGPFTLYEAVPARRL